MRKEYHAVVKERPQFIQEEQSMAIIEDFCGEEVAFIVPFKCEEGDIVKIIFEQEKP